MSIGNLDPTTLLRRRPDPLLSVTRLEMGLGCGVIPVVLESAKAVAGSASPPHLLLLPSWD